MGFFIFSEANPAIRFNFLSRSKKRDKKISTAIRARASVYYPDLFFITNFRSFNFLAFLNLGIFFRHQFIKITKKKFNIFIIVF